jgi:hypothetical protein
VAEWLRIKRRNSSHRRRALSYRDFDVIAWHATTMFFPHFVGDACTIAA